RRARFSREPPPLSHQRCVRALSDRPVPRARGRKCERVPVAPDWFFRRLPSRNRNPDHARPAAAIALRRRCRDQRQGVPCRRGVRHVVAALCRRRPLRARGWRLASPPAREADELVRTLAGVLRAGASVLYLAGRDRKEVIEAALAERFELEVAETYAAEARAAWRPTEARSLAFCVAALHYSRRSAGLAATLAKTAGVEACFLELKHVCMSRDVAEPLQALGTSSVAIAETPDEAGLFRRLGEELGGFPSLGSSRI